MAAASVGELGALTLVLMHACTDVNLQSRRGRTALMFAANAGACSIVTVLLSVSGLNVTQGDRFFESRLHSAVSQQRSAVARLLLEDGRCNPLSIKWDRLRRDESHLSGSEGTYGGVLKALLGDGRWDCGQTSADGEGILCQIVRSRDVDAVRRLLEGPFTSAPRYVPVDDGRLFMCLWDNTGWAHDEAQGRTAPVSQDCGLNSPRNFAPRFCPVF